MTNEELILKVKELLGKIYFSEDVDGTEMQDVVDNSGKVIGSLPRGVIWDNGLENYTRVVNVFLVDDNNRVLVQIRSLKKKNWPGGYDFSCGENLKMGESFEDGLKRGLKEELGVDVGKAEKIGEFVPNKKKGFACFGEVYKVVVDSDIKVQFDPNEVMEFRWMTTTEIRNLLASVSEKFKRDYRPVFEMVFG